MENVNTIKVRVNFKKLYNFLQQKIFLDYGDNISNEIKGKSFNEIVEKVQEILTGIEEDNNATL